MNGYILRATADTTVEARKPEEALANFVTGVRDGTIPLPAVSAHDFEVLGKAGGRRVTREEEDRLLDIKGAGHTEADQLAAVAGSYRGEPVTFLCIVRDKDGTTQAEPLAIILTADKITHCRDWEGTPTTQEA